MMKRRFYRFIIRPIQFLTITFSEIKD